MEEQLRVEGKQARSLNNLILIIQKKNVLLLFILICPVSLMLIY